MGHLLEVKRFESGTGRGPSLLRILKMTGKGQQVFIDAQVEGRLGEFVSLQMKGQIDQRIALGRDMNVG